LIKVIWTRKWKKGQERRELVMPNNRRKNAAGNGKRQMGKAKDKGDKTRNQKKKKGKMADKTKCWHYPKRLSPGKITAVGQKEFPKSGQRRP